MTFLDLEDTNPRWENLSLAARRRVGQAFVDSLVTEAKKEFSRRRWSLVGSDGRTRIDRSFEYEVTARGLKITSDFPGIESYATGIALDLDPEGKVITASVPGTLGDVWLSPVFRNRNFLYKGIQAGMQQMVAILIEELNRLEREG